ncbi:MAG: carbohydrate-binding protein, partial [Massilia sp.]
IWWDGDLLSEGLNDYKIEKWNPLVPKASNSLPRLLTMSSSPYLASIWDHNPMFMGDIFGDWRTEVVTLNQAHTELVIFTTNIPTTTRLYTMAHNPAYRNHMTLKGYMQSPTLDYYLGDGMSPPPEPNIRYVGSGAIQGETAELAGGTITATDRSGYRGSGFLDFPATGGSAQFNNINGGAGGAKTIAIRFANGNPTPRTGVLKVNGVAQSIRFNPSGGWSTWSTLSVPVTLAPGLANTLRFESTGQDLGNIDEVTVP